MDIEEWFSIFISLQRKTLANLNLTFGGTSLKECRHQNFGWSSLYSIWFTKLVWGWGIGQLRHAHPLYVSNLCNAKEENY
jgi:hypothetical protein